MSTRFTAIPSMQWLWCLLVLATGPGSFIAAVTVPQPQTQPQPKGPATVEAQAKYFQYRHLPTVADYDQGHRLGSEKHFTERHERARPSQGLFSAKVRWGDKHGGYGEHYWDLNHAGSTNNHAKADENDDHEHDYDYKHHEDDGSYDATVEKGNYNPNYGDGDEYDSENLAKTDFSEEISRAKRAHPKIKAEKRIYRSEKEDDGSYDKYAKNSNESDEEGDKDEEEVLKQEVQKTNPRRKSKRQHKPAIKELNLEEDPNEEQEQVTLKPKTSKNHKNNENLNTEKTNQNQDEEKSQPNHNHDAERTRVDENSPRQGRTVFNPYRADVQTINEHYGARNLQDHYVPYERQHQAQSHQDASTSASTPFRLFLEPSTGHVIDRATGLAYVLQPVAPVTNFDSYNVANYN